MLYRIGCVLVFSAVLAMSAHAQPAKRTILQQTDVAASPAQETLFGTVEIGAGNGGNGFQPNLHNVFGKSVTWCRAVSAWK